VWNDMAEAYPVVVGDVGGSPEIHEKISEKTARGAVAVFATSRGKYSYITSRPVSSSYWANDGIELHFDSRRHARLEITFDEPGAKVIFFGSD
jgi:alpha-galactosidase